VKLSENTYMTIDVSAKPWRDKEQMVNWWISTCQAAGVSLSTTLFTAAMIAKDWECGPLAEKKGIVNKATWTAMRSRL